MFNRKAIIEMIVFSFFAFLIRTFYIFMIIARYGTNQYSDFLYMQQLAESLAAGKGFTIAGQWIFNQSVGYPAFMSIFYRLFGANIYMALAINTLLGVFSVVLVYIFSLYLFRNSNKNKFIARFASFLAIIYPDSLLYCALFASENLLIPLILLLLIAVFFPWKNDFFSGTIIGILAAFAVSIKAHVAVLCLFIPLLYFFIKGRFIKQALAAILAAALCLLPWTWINYRASGGYFVPFTAVAGSVLLNCTNPTACGTTTEVYHLSPEAEKGRNTIEIDRLMAKKAISYAKERPLWFIGLTFKKFIRSFSPARDWVFELKNQARFFNLFLTRWLVTGFNAILLLNIACGIFLCRKNKLAFIFGMVILVTITLLQLIFCAYSRYRFPFLFCLLPFAGVSILYIMNFFTSKMKGSPA